MHTLVKGFRFDGRNRRSGLTGRHAYSYSSNMCIRSRFTSVFSSEGACRVVVGVVSSPGVWEGFGFREASSRLNAGRRG